MSFKKTDFLNYLELSPLFLEGAMLFYLGQIFAAWAYSHFLEYFMHRFVLHNRKASKFWFNYHFAEHHFAARRVHMIDKKYFGSLKSLLTDYEVWGLLFLGLLHFPLWFIAPAAYYTLLACGVSYYMVHRVCHIDHEKAREMYPWHYDHHMGPNQNVNWGIRLPVVDHLFNTRVKWKGSKKEITQHVLGKNGLRDYVQARSRRIECKEPKESS